MDNQFYQGYPHWRLDKYKEHNEILDKLISSEDYNGYNQASTSEKVQFLLTKIVHNNHFSCKDRLALLTKVRMEMADIKNPPNVSEILESTNMLDFIDQVMSFDDSSDLLVKYLKLEATWIMTNLTYGTDEDILKIFAYKDGIIVEHMNRLMKSNDIQIIDQILWIISNACGEGGTNMKIRNFILEKMGVIDCL